MRYLLIEPKGKGIAPNIALLKWARWCEENGHEYQYLFGIVKPDLVPDQIYMSCIFTYMADEVEKTIDYYSNMFAGVPITVGGVFPSMYPDWFNKEKWSGDKFYGGTKVTVFRGLSDKIDHLIPKYNVEIKTNEKLYPTNRIVLYSSRGCVNKCSYCAVPKIEGDMFHYKSIRKIIETGIEEIETPEAIFFYDNNFTEHKYYKDICNEVLDFDIPVDFRQGLHVNAFTEEHAKIFRKLKYYGVNKLIRFSFDKMKYYEDVKRVFNLVIDYEIPAQMECYMLYNYHDTPEDFWWRLCKAKEIVDEKGKGWLRLFPMKYEPFDPYIKRGTFIGKHWTKKMINNVRKIANKTSGHLMMGPNTFHYNKFGSTFEEFMNLINQ